MRALVKAILFDLDGTLSDRDGAVRELIREQYREFEVDLAHIPRDVYVERVLELDAHGYADKTEAYRQIAPAGLAARLADHFRENYPSFSRCFPEVSSALEQFRAKGIKLAIVTNGGVRNQKAVIDRLGLAALVDEVLISEREGIRKPDPRIFHRALDRLKVSAMESWYVGDHPITDVRGAFEAGLTAVWRYTSYWPRPDVPAIEIRSLDDLVKRLTKRFIVVSGLPGSGKTALGRQLARALNLPLIDKDDILERLFESKGIGDATWRRELSRKSDAILMADALASDGAVLVSHWHLPGMAPDSGTPTGWLMDLPGQVVNLRCICPPELAAQRFLQRKRHPGHLDSEISFVQALAGFQSLDSAGPLEAGFRVDVDTSVEVRLEGLIGSFV